MIGIVGGRRKLDRNRIRRLSVSRVSLRIASGDDVTLMDMPVDLYITLVVRKKCSIGTDEVVVDAKVIGRRMVGERVGRGVSKQILSDRIGDRNLVVRVGDRAACILRVVKLNHWSTSQGRIE